MLEAAGHQVPAQEKQAHDYAAAREAYREARARVLRFARIDPDLPRLFPYREDPVIGLQDIKVWAEGFSKEGRERVLQEEVKHVLRKAVTALLGSIEDAPAGREFGDWSKPLIAEAARAANQLGLPAPLVFHDYFDMVRQAGDADQVGITYVRYGAPNSHYSQQLILRGYRRDGERWIASRSGELSEEWRRDIIRVLRMWIRHLGGELSGLPPHTRREELVAEHVGPEYLDAFRDRLREAPASVNLRLPIKVPEREVRRAFERMLGEPFHAKDSGVEMCDLFTLQGSHGGRQVVIAAMFKGAGNKSVRWPLQMAGCGKNGTQVVRLFDVPADVYIVQANGPFDPTLVKHVHGTALARAARGHQVRFMLIDGVTTERLLRSA